MLTHSPHPPLRLRFVMPRPIGKLLDAALGEEAALYRRAELKDFVSVHAEPELAEDASDVLTTDEVQVRCGAAVAGA